MKLELPAELERMLNDKVATGRYASTDDVVAEALRLMNERDQVVEFRKEELRREIEEGVESLRQHGGLDGEAVFARLFAELDELDRVKSA